MSSLPPGTGSIVWTPSRQPIITPSWEVLPLTLDEGNDLETLAIAPGFYSGLLDQQYHFLPYVSNSRLGDLHESPAHCLQRMHEPQKSTTAQVIGSAVHMATLEDQLFAKTYYKLPSILDFRKKADRTIRDQAYDSYGEEFVLKADDYEMVERVRDSVHAHPAAKELLELEGYPELAAFWDDRNTGLRCKGKIDYLVKEEPFIVDLKTTRSASPEDFGKSVFNFGYYRQAAFYMHACSVLGKPIEEFYFIAVEKTPPYAVAVYTLPKKLIRMGMQQLEELLALYQRCLETNHWPCYDEEPQEVKLPGWAWKKLERSIDLDDDEDEDELSMEAILQLAA